VVGCTERDNETTVEGQVAGCTERNNETTVEVMLRAVLRGIMKLL